MEQIKLAFQQCELDYLDAIEASFGKRHHPPAASSSVMGDFHIQPDIEHTPTPWYRNANSFGAQFIYGNDIEISHAGKGYSKLVCGGDMPMLLTEANAAFIVEAVNSHAALKSQVEEQDRLLAEAADFLNRASRLDAMDLGAVITAYRLKQQRSVAMPLEGRGGAT